MVDKGGKGGMGMNAPLKRWILWICTTPKKSELIGYVSGKKKCHCLKYVHFEKKDPKLENVLHIFTYYDYLP